MLSGACTRSFDIQVTSIEGVDAYPTVKSDFNMPRDQPSPEEARHGFVRVRFASPIDLEAEAASRDVPFVSYDFYSCGEAKTYSTSGDIFPTPAHNDGHSYDAFLPASLSELTVWKRDGEVTTGWPSGVLANELCFKIRGFSMALIGLESREVRINGVANLLN